jgi:hypothetical protein
MLLLRKGLSATLCNMESSTIRSLIFQCNLTSEQLGLGGIAAQVLELAARQRVIDRVPQLIAGDQAKDKICEVLWGLIVEGVFAPGSGMRNPNLPDLRLTEYGKKCVEAGELTPHDPDGYADRLKRQCRSIDSVTLIYVGEALQTFRAGNHLATAVMVGVAAEQTLSRLVVALMGSLDAPQTSEKLRQATEGKGAKRQHDELMERLRPIARQLPPSVAANLEQHIGGIYDLIRQTRNEAGHPTGRKLERYESHALLLMFSAYCRTAHELMDWLKDNLI